MGRKDRANTHASKEHPEANRGTPVHVKFKSAGIRNWTSTKPRNIDVINSINDSIQLPNKRPAASGSRKADEYM
jgi:hypothetical protein